MATLQALNFVREVIFELAYTNTNNYVDAILR